jgi:hypothetical protein
MARWLMLWLRFGSLTAKTVLLRCTIGTNTTHGRQAQKHEVLKPGGMLLSVTMALLRLTA